MNENTTVKTTTIEIAKLNKLLKLLSLLMESFYSALGIERMYEFMYEAGFDKEEIDYLTSGLDESIED